jgi:hypothetical protein
MAAGPAAEARGAPTAAGPPPSDPKAARQQKPPVFVRLLIVAGLAAFASIDRNPVVRLQAELGLSPSPLERLFGLRGPFSGMTEATWRLTELDVGASLRANVLTMPLLAAAACCILAWARPQLRTRRAELAAAAIMLAACLVNNLAPRFL